jgi:tRNA pseudouridine38-40 synthase
LSSNTAAAAVRPWHVMHNSDGKLYTYRLALGEYMDPFMRHNRWQCEWGHEVDIDRLRRVLKQYEGRHNFICFSGALERNERKTGIVKTTTRTVTSCRLVCEDKDKSLYRIEIRLDGALYKMVRNMVSTAIDVARGRLDEQTFVDMLYRSDELNLSRRDNLCKPAPPVGLTLEHVHYTPFDASK